MSYSYISLFSGIGGLDLGFEEEGFRGVWAGDIMKSAVETYAHNFGRPAVHADINRVSADIFPAADVVIGGPPCQSFSLVGRRRPDDPRGKLVFRFVDIVREVNPRAFVMENVPGMAASRVEGMRLPDYLVQQFEELGYKVTVCLLLATDFFVPQLRRRIFIIGCRGAKPGCPDGDAFKALKLGIDPSTAKITARAAIEDLGLPTARGGLTVYSNEVPSQFAKLMRVGNGHLVALHEEPRMSQKDLEYVAAIPPGGNYLDIPDAIATPRVMNFKKTGGRTTTYGRLHPEKPAYTINAHFRRPNVGCNFHYSQPRLITPREAMRFQSIPDRFTITYTAREERNAMIGNAVPPLMARAVAHSVKQALDLAEESYRLGRSSFKVANVG